MFAGENAVFREATDLAVSVEDHDPVAVLGKLRGCRHTGRSGTDDDNTIPVLGTTHGSTPLAPIRTTTECSS
jgi:hypothetical protein